MGQKKRKGHGLCRDWPLSTALCIVWSLLYHESIAFGPKNPLQNSQSLQRPRCGSELLLVSTPTVQHEEESLVAIDTRPHEQRAAGPRTARRLNHAFRYLYRHDDTTHRLEDVSNMTSFQFLVDSAGYTPQQVREMSQAFPPLLDLSVTRHLWPKLRFLQSTMGLDNTSLYELDIFPQYFGARLERTIAPRHAFLVYCGLPHGRELLRQSSVLSSDGRRRLWHDFLTACRKTKQFCALCNSWRQRYCDEFTERITAKQIEAFDVLFQRGLMAAARNELCQHNNTWQLQYLPNITSADMISLLIQHGANPLERDIRGSTLLHWAAGTGNLGGVKQLLPHFEEGACTMSERDGATVLHWAAAGAKARAFGCGGHLDICIYLLEHMVNDRKHVVNQLTKDGNSILMWAAWSGTMDVVKFLVRNRADATVANRNGCTVAHWAASGGDLEVCRYLHDAVGVDFSMPNYGGNTPLTHAVAFGRADVVDWLRTEVLAGEDDVAAALAKDFVGWTDGDVKRQQVLKLFQKDDWFVGENKVISEGEDAIDVFE